MKNIYILLISCFLLLTWDYLAAQAPYCTPTYTTGCSTGVGLTRFQIGSIDQQVNCDGVPNSWYHFFQDTATLIAGVMSEITITMGSPNTSVAFWIDENNNNAFETDERRQWFLCTYANIPVPLQFWARANTPQGIHRARFRTSHSMNINTPCDTYIDGNAGDFLINVVYDSVPNAVNLLAPSDGAIGMMSDIMFNWEPGTGLPPTGYYFSLGTDNPPTTVLDELPINQSFYNSTFELAPNTTYYWEVRPYNELHQPGPGIIRSFTTNAGECRFSGYVYNTDGLPVNNAKVTIAGPTTHTTNTNAAGYFDFVSIPFGTYTMSCEKIHYNTYINPSPLNFNYPIPYRSSVTLTRPVLTITPDTISDTLPPNGFQPYPFQINNPGTGPLEWTASITYNSPNHDWLNLPVTTGQVIAGGQQTMYAILNAGGVSEGTMLDAVIPFTSVPDVGTRTLPLNLLVSGDSLLPATNASGILTDPVHGYVNLSWDCMPSNGFQYYSVTREGIEIARVPLANNYQDSLISYGLYAYAVKAVYAVGSSTPASCWVNWPNTVLVLSPAHLISHQEPNTVNSVNINIRNEGQGSLFFDFTDYTDGNNHNPLTYCLAASNGQDEFISQVQAGTINHTSGWTSYSDYTSISTDLQQNAPTPIAVTIGPPNYSSDIIGVWIDYDHNGSFDNAEFTQLSGSPIATGNILVPATALPGNTTMRIRLQNGGSLSPCGNTAYGEVEDYTVNIISPSFITDVIPASGTVKEGGSVPVNLHFSATGIYSLPGTYNTTVNLSTNDPNHLTIGIPVTMIVGPPTRIEGVVTSCGSGHPVSNMYIKTGSHGTYSDETGHYALTLDPGTYDVHFSEFGYQPESVAGIVVTAGNITTLDKTICPEFNPPTNLTASVRLDDSASFVNWSPPDASYEMFYDDGIPENFAAWQQAGNLNAVKFTPQGYPAHIRAAMFFIANGTGGSCIGSRLTAMVFTSTQEGYPGILVDSASLIVSDTGWVDIEGLDATILDGDFFIAMKQNEPWPNCPFLGEDETLPTAWKSYSRNVTNGSWGISPFQDFMIRALIQGRVSGGDGKTEGNPVKPSRMAGMLSLKEPGSDNGKQDMQPMVQSLTMMDTVQSYRIYRVSNFDPLLPPSSGVFTIISTNNTNLHYEESGSAWMALAGSWYAYGIQAVYSGQVSDMRYTNAVSHRIYSDLSINVQILCSSNAAEGAIVKLTTPGHPECSRIDTVPASGTLAMQNLPRQDYQLEVHYPGLQSYTQFISLDSNLILNIALEGYKYQPRNPYLDDKSLLFMWNEPLAMVLNEDFEMGNSLPQGWQSSSQGTSAWSVSTNGNSDYFTIPPHTSYAFASDDQGGAGNNGCCDYLVTPEMDLTGAPSYFMNFASFFNGEYGQTASVEMSTDGGVSWSPIYTCSPAIAWNYIQLDLSPYSGPSGLSSVKFAFHSNDNGNYGSGWAVDDIEVASGNLSVISYYVFLDGSLVGNLPSSMLYWTFDPTIMNYGQQYTACVETMYCDGLSGSTCYSITDHYLEPPSNLTVQDSTTTSYGAAILNWTPMSTAQSDSTVLSIKIFRNSEFIAEVPSWKSTYLDEGLAPGDYWYQLSAVYNITQWGFPGQTDESLKTEPQYINLVYGMGIPFVEDFSSGQIDTTIWNAGPNWMIDEQADNPVPAAKFNSEPVLLNYSSALESKWINALAMDSTGPYNIWLDYEIRLKDTLQTSSENLSIEVWDGSQWQLIADYYNSGSFDWTREHLNISDLAKGREFKFRFRANGESSNSIQYWSVDNILIYTETSLIAPVNLVAGLAAPYGTSVSLNWQIPSGMKNTGADLLNMTEGLEGNFRVHTADNQYQQLSPAKAKSLVPEAEDKTSTVERYLEDQQNSSVLLNFNIFRKEIGKSPLSTDTAGNFQLIASTDSTHYLDTTPTPFSINEYYVTAVYDNGESLPSNTVLISLFTGIEKALAEQVKVYPNPARDQVSIEFPTTTTCIRLFNSLGISVFEKKLNSENHLLIRTDGLASGVYSLMMIVGKKEFYGCKLVILK
ncbi:MAG: carboxypeptidase regulatory-like domain-containing protein [Bacteroidetes bacterium]|nr:carboxypeptidase regulatory-like domain-containing protein [Bacteroidota bacterium]